jgi:hypothetical protein
MVCGGFRPAANGGMRPKHADHQGRFRRVFAHGEKRVNALETLGGRNSRVVLRPQTTIGPPVETFRLPLTEDH